MIKDIKFSEETKEFSTGAHRGGGNDKFPTAYLPLVEATEVLLFKQKSFPCKKEKTAICKSLKTLMTSKQLEISTLL